MSIEKRIGFYAVTPLDDLAKTAKAIADALKVDLREDLSGNYEEFPAFVGSGHGWHLALLGNPKPEDDLRESPTNDFELQVQVMEGGGGYETTAKVDELILGKLRANGLLVAPSGWGT